MENKLLKGYLFAICSAVIYGLMPLMAKHIYAEGINALTLVFLRNFLALPSLGILAFWKHKTLKISLKELPKIGLIAFFGCTLTPLLLFSSYNYIPTGTATVFHFVYPSLVVIISLFMGKKVPLATLFSVLLCFVGICLFYDPAVPFDLQGSTLALASAITFAIYVSLLSGSKNGAASGLLLSFYIVVISSILTFILCIATHSLTLPTTFVGWMLCLFFAFMVTTLAVVFFQQGAFLIGGVKTSILSTLEPITGVIAGYFAFAEAITLPIAIGSFMVIGASILAAIFDRKNQ